MTMCDEHGYPKKIKTCHNRIDEYIDMLKHDSCIICQTEFSEHVGVPGFGLISYNCSCTKVMTTHVSCWCRMIGSSGNGPVKCPQCCKNAWIKDESGDQVDMFMEKRQENSIGDGYDETSDTSTHEYTDEDNIDVGPFEDEE